MKGRSLMQFCVSLSAMLAMVLVLTSCCTEQVANIGKTQAELNPTAAFENQKGDIILQCNLSRTPINKGGQSVFLGTRYCLIESETIDSLLKQDRSRRYWSTTNLQISVYCLTNQGCSLYPTNIFTKIENPPPPSALQATATNLPFNKQSGTFGFHREFQGTNYSVEFRWAGSRSMWYPEAYHQSASAYPIKVLLFIPAVAVDVCFSPIEFIWFMNTGLGAR